jgi:tetratricopeptide (TPR) repeat protein
MIATFSPLVLLLVASPSPDPQETRQVQATEHAQAAEALAEQGRYAEAERALRAAYALDASVYHLYGLGVLAAEQGDCETAITTFREVIAALPSSPLDTEARQSTRAAAQERIAACVAAKPTPLVRTTPDSPQSTDAPPTDHWRRDVVGGVLLGGGTASVAAGAGLLIAAAVIDDGSARAVSAQDFRAEQEQARTLGTAGVVVLACGGALVTGAIVRYALVRRRNHRRSSLAVGLSPAAFALSWTASF